jgi:CheY-like chemotaxis protein
MFTQVGRSIGQAEGGLGIGLALAKSLVEMHDGTIEARSEGLGKGSEFIVRLPMAQSTSTTTQDQVHSDIPTPVRRRILIADDNRDVLDTFEVMLQMHGHDVATASDGLEVLEKAAAFRPEVIVLDIGMPNLDGFETARRLRQEPWGRDAVLIAVTGWGHEKDKQQSAQAGFNIHLVKPVDANTILKHLENWNGSKTKRKAGK